VDAAKSAKQSMRIVTGEINNIQGAIDLMSMEIKTLRRNLSEMTDANASLKNTTILCGIGSAIAGGLLWSLIGAQSPQIQPTQGQTSQSVRVGR
jgi:hypothetical protein